MELRGNLFCHTMSANSPTELSQLKELVSTLQSALESSQREVALLRQKVDVLVRQLFRAKSEKIDPAQLELLLQLASSVAAADAAPAKPIGQSVGTRSRKERRPRLPENLPVVEEVLDPAPVKQAPELWRCIGQEVNEQLDYEPGRFLRRRIVRRKYVHRSEPDQTPVIAALPERLLERGLAAPGLLAHLLVSKYCDHLPLYRQEQIFSHRYGVRLPRQTLARWVELAADWLKPIYEHIQTGVMAGGYLQIDETPIRYLSPGNGKTKLGYLWTAHRPRGDVFFRWEPSRAAACLQKIVPVDFTGTIQCDGYSAYDSFARTRVTTIRLAGCWAHVRRKFHEALEQSPRTAGWLMRQIQHLYRIEARLRVQGSGPNLRLAVRVQESRPLVDRFRKALVAIKASGRHLPQSLLGQAVDYALSQWSGLEIFLTDGRVEIDNNQVENSIRPTAIGKKNWLFVGAEQAGERSAIVYTIVESCRRRGIEPFTYLRDVLSRLPHMTNRQIGEVTPESWANQLRPILRPIAS